MKLRTLLMHGLVLAGTLALTLTAVLADTFGTGANSFSIDFVEIGNAGNGPDTTGYGAVPYSYRMGVTEVPQDWIDKTANLGLAHITSGPWVAMQPAGGLNWYEAAAFVN